MEKEEIVEVKRTVLFRPTEWKEVVGSLSAGQKPGTWMHDLVLNAARGLIPSNPNEIPGVLSGRNQFRAPLLGAVPCGPWQESIDAAKDFVTSEDMADFLELREGDVWADASGHSMEGAGITDGSRVALRPLDGRAPRRGEIVLIQVTTESGTAYSTLKRWDGAGATGQPPKLLDGADQLFELPADTVTAVPTARAVAVVSRL